MTYNSNHIHGESDKANTIYARDGVPVDDILGMGHHFRAIDVAEDSLAGAVIKHLHYNTLEHDAKDSTLRWIAVGEHARRAHMAGGHETTRPK